MNSEISDINKELTHLYSELEDIYMRSLDYVDKDITYSKISNISDKITNTILFISMVVFGLYGALGPIVDLYEAAIKVFLPLFVINITDCGIAMLIDNIVSYKLSGMSFKNLCKYLEDNEEEYNELCRSMEYAESRIDLLKLRKDRVIDSVVDTPRKPAQIINFAQRAKNRKKVLTPNDK